MTITRVVTATRAGAWAKGAVLLTALCAAAAGPAADRHLPVRIEISNATGAALECQALAAHWYSFPVRRVEPHQSVTMSFAYLPTAGEVIEPASRLPVETLYCGWAGRAWATRTELDLHALAARGSAAVACQAGEEALACKMR